MKTITFENMRNKEKYSCKNLQDVHVIEGIEYLKVIKFGTQHECLIKKDLLKKIKDKS
jgi:hypothetical protein